MQGRNGNRIQVVLSRPPTTYDDVVAIKRDNPRDILPFDLFNYIILLYHMYTDKDKRSLATI